MTSSIRSSNLFYFDEAVCDESARASALAAHDVAAIDSRDGLDAVTAFAAALCDAPIALVSLVEAERQWFPARTGLDVAETPRETSFCAHAMVSGGIMEIPDATRDPRFADNPLVTGDPGIRFYAGAPLVSDDGVPLGSLCIIDRAPRAGLTDLQRQGLDVLANDVMSRLNFRRGAKSQREADAESAAELHDRAQRFEVLADTMPQMIWSTRPDGFHDYYNARWYEYTGMPEGSTDGDAWNGMFHPDDQDRALARWSQSLATGEPYEIEYRLRNAAGEYRWTLGRALPIRDGDGTITRWFGTCTDIHETKLVQEEREIVSHELSHRIKNIFSVISGLIGFSTREHPEFGGIASELRERVMALGRAHDFVRPHSEASRPTKGQTSLHGMLEELFAPYQAGPGSRIVVTGADPEIDDRSATPFALVFHELATNAAKYGALSTDTGRVTLTIMEADETVKLEWREQGGPAVSVSAASDGFGTRLIELSAVRQLGGTVTRDWQPGGLIVTVAIPRAAMTR